MQNQTKFNNQNTVQVLVESLSDLSSATVYAMKYKIYIE